MSDPTRDIQYEYIDTHSHLNFQNFDTEVDGVSERDRLIAQMKEEKIATITVGTTVADSRAAIALAEKHEHLFATVGIHPTRAWTEEEFAELEKLAAHPKVVAIGECGLDFFRIDPAVAADPAKVEQLKMRQGQAFARHIEIALKYNKPLVIHCRAAYEEALHVIQSYQMDKAIGNKLRGVMHFFAGTPEIAQKFLAAGFMLSFAGPITFARDYDEVIKNAPLDRIMSETDSPFAAPVPFRGKPNKPIYVKEVAAKIAEIRGEDLQMVKKKLVDNARKAFDI